MSILSLKNQTVVRRVIEKEDVVILTITHDQTNAQTYTKINVTGVSKGYPLTGKYKIINICSMGSSDLSDLKHVVKVFKEQPLEMSDHDTFITCKFLIGQNNSIMIVARRVRTNEDKMFDILMKIPIDVSIGIFRYDEREHAARNAIGAHLGKCDQNNQDNIVASMVCGLKGILFQREREKNMDKIREEQRIKDLITANTSGTLKELNKKAKRLGIPRYSTFNKADLILCIADFIKAMPAAAH